MSERLRRAQGQARAAPKPKASSRYTLTLVPGWLLALWEDPGHRSSYSFAGIGRDALKPSGPNQQSLRAGGLRASEGRAAPFSLPGLVPTGPLEMLVETKPEQTENTAKSNREPAP